MRTTSILHRSHLVLIALMTLTAATVAAAQTGASQPPDHAAASSSPALDAASSNSAVSTTPRNHDALLDVPPVPHSQVTLIGGIVTKVDQIEDRLTVKPFSGKQSVRLDFDLRTHIFLDGKATSGRDLQPGERVYLDTMLDGTHIFAKNIWIENHVLSGSIRGQIIRYDERTNKLSVRDDVSAEPSELQLDSSTVIRDGNTTRSIAELKPDSLVVITFDSGSGRTGIVRQVSLLAAPGSVFSFLGKVTFVDLSQKLIAVTNQSDDKSYDIYFDTVPPSVLTGLREGSQASISAMFDGTRYVAEKVDVIRGPAPR